MEAEAPRNWTHLNRICFCNFVHVIDMIGTVDVISHKISFLRILALEGETMEILVTGFDPFDGEPINSLGSRKTP